MRSILLLAVVAVISLLAGIAVTGLPEDVPDDVVSSAISVTATTATTTTSAPRTTAATTTTSDSRDPAATDSRPADSDAASTTTAGLSSSTSTSIVAPTALRVVVANAGGAPGVASRTAQELRALGYPTVSATNATLTRPDTVVVHAPGREAEAGRLAAQLGLSPQQIAPQTAERLTASGAPADLVVLLGADRA